MDENEFWQLIDRSRRESGGDVWDQAALLTDALAEWDPEEIVSFDRHFAGQMRKAYRADLWAAAYIVNQGCSDDAFADFRAWLIGQGKQVFEAVLADPERLGDLVEPGETADCEDMLFAGSRAYRRRTGGQDVPEDAGEHAPVKLQGSHLTPEQRQERFPNLWRRYLGSGD